MDDAECTGIGIIDADLLRCELVLDQFVFDTLIGQRASGIESKRLEVARQHFHRCNPALLDRLDELGPGRERKILAAP
jgi:hypothetical protein